MAIVRLLPAKSCAKWQELLGTELAGLVHGIAHTLEGPLRTAQRSIKAQGGRITLDEQPEPCPAVTSDSIPVDGTPVDGNVLAGS